MKGTTVNQSLTVGSTLFTMTGDSALKYTQSIGTSEEALELGQDIGTLGWCMIKNLDATNFVSIRAGTGLGNFLRINAGEFALFRFGSGATAPFAIADTGAVLVEVLLIET